MSLLGSGSVHVEGRHARARGPAKASASTVCQRCLQAGHWTYECKNPPAYKPRPTRTQQLLNPRTRRYLDPSDLLPEDREKDATQNSGSETVNKLDGKNKKKQKRKAEAASSTDSDSSSSSDSDSSSSSSSDSDSSSSSSDDSSDSDTSSSDSDSSSSSSDSDSDSSDSSDSDDSSDSSSSSDSESGDSDSSGSDSVKVKKAKRKGASVKELDAEGSGRNGRSDIVPNLVDLQDRGAAPDAGGRGGNGASAAKRRRLDPDDPRSNGHDADGTIDHTGGEHRHDGRERHRDSQRDDRRDGTRGGDRGRRERHDAAEHENGHAQPSERHRSGIEGRAEGRQSAGEAQRHRGRGSVKADIRSRLGPVAVGRGAPVEDGIAALRDGTLPPGTASPQAPVELPADDDRWDMDA